MKKLTTKPRYVLLDANVVIKAHELGVWTQLKSSYQLTLPATVSKREVLYFLDDGHKIQINLQEQIDGGEIYELEAIASELEGLINVFEPWFLETLDPGETEALVLFQNGRVKDTLFCTADAPAIKALVMMGMSSLGVSFEGLLTKVGLNKKLEKQFTDSFFLSCCRQGSIDLVQGTGLRVKNRS